MKNLTQKIFLIIMLIVLVVFGVEIYSEFMVNHTYYNTMFASWENWKTVVAAIIAAGVPVLYLIINKSFSLKKFIIYLVSGLLLFSLLHIRIKDGLVGSGFIIYIINNLLLFVLGAYFIVGTLALGKFISKLIIKFKENRIQELFLNFGLGLGIILLLTQLLMGFGLFHPVVVRVIFLGLSGIIWLMRYELKEDKNIISNLLSGFKLENLKKNRWQWIMLVLVIFSIIYYFYGFQLSFIPYSTAWDANHEYLYVPKVIAENFGIIRGNVGTAGAMPFLRHSFIAFWFSIGKIFTGSWLSPDTVAVSMNFLSGPFVLFFGLALINEAIEYFGEKLKLSQLTKSLSFGTGWMTLLLWLTSGMGAFLVFVDNKTDLGVMALTILAILSGFIFIRYISENKSKKIFDKESLKYLILSGFFFALASMSKPSAFIDVVVFGVLLVLLWINSLVGIGVGTIALGMMGILQPVNAADFMGVAMGKLVVIIGAIITLIGLAQIFIRNTKQELFSKRKLFSYIVVWGISLLASLLIFKGPRLLYKQVLAKDAGIKNFVEGLFLANNNGKEDKNIELKNKILLATNDFESLEAQNETDREILLRSDNINKEGSMEQCLNTKFTKEELEEGKKEAVVGNEDVGRYVGYGWKEFTDKRALSYGLLRLIYPKNNTCYGANSSARFLCKNKDYINAGNIEKLEEILKSGKIKVGSPAEELITKTLEEYKENPDSLRTNIVNLKQYYENHSIYTQKGKINVPSLSYGLLRLIYPKNNTCYGANSSARFLCKNKDYINAGNIEKLEEILKSGKIKVGSPAEELITKTLEEYKENPDSLRTNIVNLKQYYENHSIYTQKGKINVPYRYIIPGNITFNRSLQNLSSYYTDIGFIWMFIFIFTAFGLIYSIIRKNQKLFALSFATVVGWAIWRVIGGAILWYGIGLIMRTILVLSMFIQDLINKDNDEGHKLLLVLTLGALGLWMLVQMFFNLIRISSQGASGPFLWFKQSVGKVTEVTDDLRIEEKVKIGYSQKDVFDLQFPHYNKFIEYTKDRDDKDGVLIAGTYLQYFLDNQRNLKSDGGLAWFWEQGSDENTCKMYQRIKSENIKYLVIDPNIATVVMGEGNESLFHRFFAKTDPISGKVIEKGSMLMLAQLVDQGYGKLFYSNNLGAKYGFGLSDEELTPFVGTKSKDELNYLRAQLAAARFLPNSNELVNMIAQIFNSRVSNGKAVGDIADVYGKTIDEAKIINTMNVFLSNPESVSVMVSTLTQDERFVLIQYINLYSSLRQNNIQQYQEMINNIMMASLAGGSQLIIVELR
ncbi:MAG TPA: hypothetical protein P5155_02135 [Candidatus Absconditabacterales bacterium]|nr:hypothetical protein [Candidatus Absconditabacterales bacterium]